MDSVEIPSGRFGRYRLTAKVGEGGLAEVYRAEVVEPGGVLRTVALKVLKRGVQPEAAPWFAQEAEVMDALRHPNLVRKLESGEVAGRPYLALEDVFGGTLAQLIAAHRAACVSVPLPVALRVAIELLTGLAHVHAATDPGGSPLHLVHGDVTPANVLLSVEGDVKLCDFGRVRSPVVVALRPHALGHGKVHYLSPEQARGAEPTPASDIFAVGVILFELTLGFRPFDGPTDADVLEQIATCEIEGPEGIVAPGLSRILRRALARHPSARYATAGALCGDLTAFALDAGQHATREQLAAHLAEVLGVVP